MMLVLDSRVSPAAATLQRMNNLGWHQVPTTFVQILHGPSGLSHETRCCSLNSGGYLGTGGRSWGQGNLYRGATIRGNYNEQLSSYRNPIPGLNVTSIRYCYGLSDKMLLPDLSSGAGPSSYDLPCPGQRIYYVIRTSPKMIRSGIGSQELFYFLEGTKLPN